MTAAAEVMAAARVPPSVTDSPATSDQAGLVEALRRGESGAFERLYRRFAPVAHGILLARVPRPEVDDLMQEVFLIVFRRIRTLRDANAFPGWLAMIARNRAVDFHRRAPRTEELVEDVAGAGEPPGDAEAILRVVRGLPEAYREPLVLRLVEGLTGPEIAARTGLTPGSVRVNLHRGMHRLREELRRRGLHG